MGRSPLSHLSACAPILRRAAPRGRPRGLHVAAGGRLRRTRRSQPAFTPGKRAREAAASGDTERGKPHRLPGAAGPASRCGPDGAPRPPERPGTAAFRAPAAGGRLYLPRGRPARMGRTGGGPARAPPPQSTAAPAAPGPSPTRRVRHSHVTRRPRRRAPRSASRGRRCPLVPAGSCSSSATPGPPRRRPEPAAMLRTAFFISLPLAWSVCATALQQLADVPTEPAAWLQDSGAAPLPGPSQLEQRNEHRRERLHPWHCGHGSETNVERKRREGDDIRGPSPLHESLCTGLLRRAEGHGRGQRHRAITWQPAGPAPS